MTDNVSPSLREAIEAAVAADEASAAPVEPARDEAGRFAEAAPEVEAKPEPEAAAPEAEPDDYDEAVGLDRETWKLTPAQARERAKVLAKEAREAAERAKQYEPVERVLSARRDALRATYGDEGRALEQLFHLSDWAGRDFTGFVQHLAQQRGVDLRALVPQQQQPEQGQPQTYEQLVAAAREEARRAAAEEFEQRKISTALQDFDGNTALEYRHDPDIRKLMAGILNSGAASDYVTAYQMAAKAHPTISAKLAERERSEAAKREGEAAAQRAREKASAAVSVKGAPGTSAPASAAAPSTVRAAVMAAVEQHGGRI